LASGGEPLSIAKDSPDLPCPIRVTGFSLFPERPLLSLFSATASALGFFRPLAFLICKLWFLTRFCGSPVFSFQTVSRLWPTLTFLRPDPVTSLVLFAQFFLFFLDPAPQKTFFPFSESSFSHDPPRKFSFFQCSVG